MDFIINDSYLNYSKCMIEDRIGHVLSSESIFIENKKIHFFLVMKDDSIQLFSGHGIPFHIPGDIKYKDLDNIGKKNRLNFIKKILIKEVSKYSVQKNVRFSLSEKSTSFIALLKIDDEIEIIARKLRKSYFPLIKKTNKNFFCKQIEYSKIVEKNTFDFYCQISGGVNRTWRSWQAMWEANKFGEGVAIACYEKNQRDIVGFGFFHHGKNSAYYSVGAFDRRKEFKSYGLGHATLWGAIKVLKQKNISELILTCVANSNVSPKQESILNFYRGFRYQSISLNELKMIIDDRNRKDSNFV